MRHYAEGNKPATEIQMLCDSIGLGCLEQPESEREGRRGLPGAGGGRSSSYRLLGAEFQFCKTGRALERDGRDG